MKKRVVVGMSGGIDSFVTALLLQQKGYDVIGVNLILWEKNDLSDVRNNCEKLGIPLICHDGSALFRTVVVNSFVDHYLAGNTPSPCCICNGYVKWKLLDEVAAGLQVPYMATGHYVRIIEEQGKYYIRKGVDEQKDQSYFLWGLGQEILSKALTPLGEYVKSEVKAWALKHGYEEMVRRRESMGICFLQGRDYREFLYEYGGEIQKPGKILNRAGQVIGEHLGLLNYTIGQKRGMPLRDGQALYVAGMDAERNVLVADVKSGLWTMELQVKEFRVTSREDLFAPDVCVRIRGLGLNPNGYVKVQELPGNCLKIYLSEPAWAVAPGQPVAFYRQDRLIGGGIAQCDKW